MTEIIMICVTLHGGLGNRLFQLAAAYAFSKRSKKSLKLIVNNDNTHSSIDYFDNIFKEYKNFRVNKFDYKVFYNESPENFARFVNIDPIDKMLMKGFFQCEKYFVEHFSTFVKTLCLPSYPKQDRYFLHIRGGDYLRMPKHFVNLEKYYKKAIEHMSTFTNSEPLVFTDDEKYAKSLGFTPTTVLNEIDCLAQMSSCTIGGICANSTFSWWGAYLNQNPDKIVIMPSVWINIGYFIDIYPSNTVIIDV